MKFRQKFEYQKQIFYKDKNSQPQKKTEARTNPNFQSNMINVIQNDTNKFRLFKLTFKYNFCYRLSKNMTISILPLLTLIICSSSSIINITIPSYEIEIKLNQVLETKAMPGFDINDLKIKQLFGDTYSFSNICRIKPASLSLQPHSRIHFQEQQNKSQILYRLQDLKNLKNVVDLAEHNGFYYVLFQQGFINVYQRFQRKPNNLEKIGNLLFNKTLTAGYFAKNKNSLIYVSENQFLTINQTHLREVSSYKSVKGLSYVRLFDNGNLFISVANQGVYYHHYDESKSQLENRTFLNVSKILNLSYVQIQDFAYDTDSNTLIISNFMTGIYFFKFQNQELKKIENQFINKTKCQNMIFRHKVLYLTCDQLIRYNLSNQVIETKPISIYPQDLIVTQTQEIILVGGFHVSYYKNWNWYPTFGQIKEPSRLVYLNSSIVYINRYGLIDEKITFIPQQLLCDTSQKGIYQLILHGQGACSRNQFVKDFTNQSIKQQDICSYQFRITLQVWQAFSIKWIFITIGALISAVLLAIFLIWIIIKRRLVNKTYNQLVQTPEIQPTQDSFRQNQAPSFSDPTGRELAHDQIKQT